MRKVFAFLVVGSLLFAACAEDNPTIGATGGTATGGTGATTPATAADCAAANADAFKSPGTLTIGTDNPAFPPWFSGGETDAHSEWKFDDPLHGQGLRGGHRVRGRRGDGVHFGPGCMGRRRPSPSRSRPATKDFDFVIEQISYSAGARRGGRLQRLLLRRRAGARGGEGIAGRQRDVHQRPAGTKLGAPIGTTSSTTSSANIRRRNRRVYDDALRHRAAPEPATVDAIVVDAADRLLPGRPFVQEVKHGVVVGLFRAESEQSTSGSRSRPAARWSSARTWRSRRSRRTGPSTRSSRSGSPTRRTSARSPSSRRSRGPMDGRRRVAGEVPEPAR